MKKLINSSLVLVAGLLFASAAAAQDLTVAVAGPMTGREAVFGRQMRDGAELAVADINAAGGVLGKKLKLQVSDDQCDPKQARSIAEQIASSKLPFVAGHYCSSSSIPASEAYAEGGVLQITPNDKTTYGKGLADETKKAMNKAGVQEKVFESYTKGESDFTALVSKMKAAGIDVVFVGGYHQEAGLILRQMRDQGMKTVLMAGDALADKEFAAITGAAGEGTLMTFGSDPRKRPTAAAIVDRFKAKGIDPEGYTLYSYAAFQIWAQAATQAGTTDPKKVAETIRAGNWGTVLGPISYDKKGDITALDYVIYVWKKDGTYSEM